MLTIAPPSPTLAQSLSDLTAILGPGAARQDGWL